MKSPSLDRFYLQISKAILLAASFTEIEELSFIIKSCRLKPYDIFYKNLPAWLATFCYIILFIGLAHILKTISEKFLKINSQKVLK